MNKVLIYDDKGKKQTFKAEVIRVKDGCNTLIDVFNRYQPFMKIVKLQDAESLILGPLGFYDSTVLRNIELPNTKYLRIDIVALCQLYSIDRPGFLNALGVIADDDCPDCNKSKAPKAKGELISWATYREYSQYLTFADGTFSVNEPVLKARLEAFDVFASTERQVMVLEHFNDLYKVLLRHQELGFIGSGKLSDVCRLLGGSCKVVDNVLYQNDELIKNQILKVV